MVSPLLETKLYVPRRRGGLAARPRLSERLNLGAESNLTLVSAPAGFGKTTLLTEWLDLSKYSVAWVSLDPADNHAASFWSYIIAIPALLLGDLALTEEYARRALDLAPDDEHLGRGSAAALLGLAASSAAGLNRSKGSCSMSTQCHQTAPAQLHPCWG